MSYMSQNFRLFHTSNLSVINFRFFLFMYPGSAAGVAVLRPAEWRFVTASAQTAPPLPRKLNKLHRRGSGGELPDQNGRLGRVAAWFVRTVAGAVTHLLLMWDNPGAEEGCVTFRLFVLWLGYRLCSCYGSLVSANCGRWSYGIFIHSFIRGPIVRSRVISIDVHSNFLLSALLSLRRSFSCQAP